MIKNERFIVSKFLTVVSQGAGGGIRTREALTGHRLSRLTQEALRPTWLGESGGDVHPFVPGIRPRRFKDRLCSFIILKYTSGNEMLT